MQSPKLQEGGEPDVTVGPKTGPAAELPAESGELEPDNPITDVKEEAGGEWRSRLARGNLQSVHKIVEMSAERPPTSIQEKDEKGQPHQSVSGNLQSVHKIVEMSAERPPTSIQEKDEKSQPHQSVSGNLQSVYKIVEMSSERPPTSIQEKDEKGQPHQSVSGYLQSVYKIVEMSAERPPTSIQEKDEESQPHQSVSDTSYASSISVDAMYPDPSDSFPGGLFPGSFDWSSPDSSSEGRNNIGGVAGQEACEEKASRPGNSRVPGKDHRRYYHNHWRLEYLMDFNPRCHSMNCMVCGSSLATLKLSTIKRHIRQKHPYSIYWTPSDKEVIISSWEAHLGVDAQTLAGSEEHMAENMKAKTGPKKKRRRLPPVAKGTWRPVLGPDCPLPSPMDKTQLEQYMNESLKRWFRLEFLMDFNYQGNQLHCMSCTMTLPSLCLTDIKHHILDNHPTSLQYSHSQKSVIINAWINRKENPEMEREGDMTPVMELDGDMTPEIREDMDDDKEKEKLPKKDGKCDTVAQKSAKPRPKNRKLKAKSSTGLMEKDIEFGEEKTNTCSTEMMEEEERLEASDMELLEDEESITEDDQLLDKEEWDTKDLQRIADEEWKVRKKHLLESLRILEEQQKPREEHAARKGQILEEEKKKTKETQLLKEEKKTREKQLLEEQEKDREYALLEEPQKLTDAQLPEEKKMKAKESNLQEEKKRKAEETQLQEEKRKAKEAQIQEEEKKNAHEVQMQEEETRKAKEAELSEEEKPNTKELHLQEEEKIREDHQLEEKKTNANPAHLLKEENGNATEDQLLDEDMIKIEELEILEIEELEEDTPKDQELKLKEEKEVSSEVQNVVREITVKLEDHQYADVSMNKTEKTQIINHVQAEKIQVRAKMGEGGKPQPKVTETRIIKVTPMPQAPTVLGIGLPMIKMKTPTPLIITRVSVLPEHTILQAAKPKPSTSAEISKTYRVIAPKVTPPDSQNQTTSASTDASQSPAGVDPTVWEVSMSRANSGSVTPSNLYQLRWRSEYMMDFNGVRGSVVCMYCSSSLTVLKESSIRRHIAQKHAHTVNFTAEEKAAVILDWENKLTNVKKIGVKPNKEGSGIGDKGVNISNVPDGDSVEPQEEESNWTGVLPEGKGASWEFAFGRLQGKVKDPGRYQHDRWKLEFLMDYTPAKDGLICMVCGVILMNPKISTVKMHIQQKHPDTTYLSDQEKAVVMEEWEQKLAAGHKPGRHTHGRDEICIEINEDSINTESNGSSVTVSSPHPEIVLPALSKTPKTTPSLPPPCNSAKPNYQVRWRTEFMMDYDCRRQGLICMVCGGTLATLKVSTIKRHIVQVHPYSVDFTAEERKRILDAYSEMALHYIHSEECFKTQPQKEVKGHKRKLAAMEES
ncbi:zinc finger translocation-associated protein isoform X3 [Dendrobates tinctorius]|uniref:zinc finger translocation-associated protein isoform X3 n=1 Tax=Dendrobates tinctorius TaxID=92724 RepID=UPI003CC95F1F